MTIYDLPRSLPAEAHYVPRVKLYSLYGIETERCLKAIDYQGHVTYMRLITKCYSLILINKLVLSTLGLR